MDWFHRVEDVRRDPQKKPLLELLSTFPDRCEGVDEADVRRNAWRYLWQAASGGSVFAMFEFSLGAEFDRDNPAMAADGWQLYRDHAREMLTRAIDAGDVASAFWAAAFYGNGQSFGGEGVFPQDPYLAIVYANAAMPYLDGQRQETMRYRIDHSAQLLSPDQVLQARADGTALSIRMAAAGATIVDWPESADGGERNAAVDCDR